MSRVDAWNSARSVLCIRLDNMGDVLMTTPAMRALKSAVPERRLTLMASRSGAGVASYVPEVDDVLSADTAWVKNDAAGNHQDWGAIRMIHEGGFDAAVIFTVYSQSALPAAMMCHLAGVPLVLAHSRENPYRLISDWVRETEPENGIRHEVQRQLDLVATVGAVCEDPRLSFATRPTDRLRMRERLSTLGVTHERGWVVAHCGATAPSRRYPADQFAAALSLLNLQGRRLLLTGTASERALLDYIIDAAEMTGLALNLAGELSLGELGCLIEDADVLISNNTGPVHIAAAVQTPVVDLYALTNPQHTPWEVEQRVLSADVACKYCYRSVCPMGTNACLAGIAPRTVAQAVHELMEERYLHRPGAHCGHTGTHAL